MLTEKQRRFIEAYLIEPNGKKAAIAAGYAAGSAEIAASRLLRHAGVAAELQRRRDMAAKASGVTPERVLAELAKLGFSDIREVVVWRSNVSAVVTDPETDEDRIQVSNEVTIVDSAKLTPDVAAAIAEVSQSKDGTLKVKMHDKLGALTKMGQHLGMFRPQTLPEEPGKKQKRQEEATAAAEGDAISAFLN